MTRLILTNGLSTTAPGLSRTVHRPRKFFEIPRFPLKTTTMSKSCWIRCRWTSCVYMRAVSRRKFAELSETSPTKVYRFFKDERVQTCKAAKPFDHLGISDVRPYQFHAGDNASGSA